MTGVGHIFGTFIASKTNFLCSVGESYGVQVQSEVVLFERSLPSISVDTTSSYCLQFNQCTDG